MPSFLARFLLIFLPLSVNAQLPEDVHTALEQEVLRLVNALREEKGLSVLQLNDELQKAAIGHSLYMAKNKVLSHEEKSGSVKTPEKRVKKAGGKDFESVGENILYLSPEELPVKRKQVNDLALALFSQWKSSPPHYANMINGEYSHTGFGFAIDEKESRLYATEVFGKKGVRVEGQLSKNGFGIQQGTTNCNLLLGNKSNLVTNIGNAIRVEGNEVILYYHNIEKIKQLFDQPKDGIAVDIILDEQLECGHPNELDMSEIYDGILLQPVYRDALLAGNRATGDYRFIAPIGLIPEHLRGKSFSISLLIIQNGMECSYTFPVCIPKDHYELRPVEPVLLRNEGIQMKRSGVVYSVEHHFDFERGEITGVMQEPDILFDDKIVAVDIISHSSVEGTSASNERLDNSRAAFMHSQLQNYYGEGLPKPGISATENWIKMRFQLDYFGFSELARQSNDSIKRFLIANQSPFWDSLLFTQRHSVAILHLSDELPEEASPGEIASLNFRDAIAMKNIPKANEALYHLYQSKESADVLFETAPFNALKSNAFLVQNAAAVLSVDPFPHIYQCAELLNCWMNKMDELTKEAQFNLLHLYTIVSYHLTEEWDVSSQQLAKVIHPDKTRKYIEQQKNPSLLLNYHLTAIQYFGQINHVAKTIESFDYISSKILEYPLSDAETEALVLFYNNWSRYDLTIQALLPHINDSDFPEEHAFILAVTAFVYDHGVTEEQLTQIMEKAAGLNPKRWCKLIRDNNQLKRLTFVKNHFCTICQNSN